MQAIEQKVATFKNQKSNSSTRSFISKNHELVIAGFFAALAVTLGYALVYVPNIELVTATIFMSGYFLGIRKGIVVGAVAEFIFSLIHPLGASAPPLLIAQVLSMVLVGFCGGVIGRWQLIQKIWFRIFIFAFMGFSLTLIFDVLTTLSFVVFLSGTSLSKIIATFSIGSLFYFTHLIGNTIVFSLFLPVFTVLLESRYPLKI